MNPQAMANSLLPRGINRPEHGFTDHEVNELMNGIQRRGDAIVSRLMLVHGLVALALAFLYSTWLVTFLVGGAAVAMHLACARLLPGSFFTRCVAGVALQTFVALHIYQLHGLAEMHFFFFTGWAVMIIYMDRACMWPGTLLIITQHILFALLHNSGVQVFFFEDPFVGVRKLFFHFGIAVVHVGICSYWAFLLRQQTLADAWQRRNLNEQRYQVESDLQRRVETERALRDSEARVRLVIDTALDAVVTMDEGGKVTCWNSQAEIIFGWQANEAIGRPMHELIIPPHHRHGHLARLRRFLHTQEGRMLNQRIEIVALRRDGTEFPVELAIAPLRGTDGMTFSAFVRDITERRRMETELRLAKETAEATSRELEDTNQQLEHALERANRLALAAEVANHAKSDFLATMSHEIRTPMNGVIGFTNLLLDTQLDSDQKELTETIKNSGEALLALINDILDFSKIEAGKLSVERIGYDLQQAIEEVVDLLRPRAAEKRVELVMRYAQGLPRRLVGDPGRVRQVLLNLMSNALKFTERGSVSIEVRLADVARPPGVGQAAMPGGRPLRKTSAPDLVVAVRDTGIGIPPDKQAILFQRFTQGDSSTTRRFGGTGLGLAICKRLVELMGGTIGLESKPKHGSTFWFTLPTSGEPSKVPTTPDQPTPMAAPERGTLPPPSAIAASGAPRQGAATVPHAHPHRSDLPSYRVLLTEDNATNQRLAKRLLEKLGCRVDLASNGREAVELVSRLPYDVVFMDCQMPEMDGLEATAAIRRWEIEQLARRSQETESFRPRIPIIAITAGVMETDRTRCADAGMDGFIPKPLRSEDLRNALDKWCAGALRAP